MHVLLTSPPPHAEPASTRGGKGMGTGFAHHGYNGQGTTALQRVTALQPFPVCNRCGCPPITRGHRLSMCFRALLSTARQINSVPAAAELCRDPCLLH